MSYISITFYTIMFYYIYLTFYWWTSGLFSGFLFNIVILNIPIEVTLYTCVDIFQRMNFEPWNGSFKGHIYNFLLYQILPKSFPKWTHLFTLK